MSSNNWLNRVMEFDHVIRVRPDGTVDEHPEPHVYAPESVIETDEDGQILAGHETAWIEYLRSQGWEPERGWTGQYGYAGPIMHPSEYIGGHLADHILETPGLWVAVSVECIPWDEDGESDAAGWAVLYRES